MAALGPIVGGPGLGELIFSGLRVITSPNAVNLALMGTLGVVARRDAPRRRLPAAEPGDDVEGAALMGAMIELERLSKRYPGQSAPAVDALDLTIAEGEIVILVGPSGCGKTTTLKMINRIIEPTSGTIRLQGEDVTRADPDRLRRRIGYVIQQVGPLPAPDHRPQHHHGPPAAGLAAQADRRAARRAAAPGRDGPRRPTGTGSRRSSPAVSASASAWPARWRPTRP